MRVDGFKFPSYITDILLKALNQSKLHTVETLSKDVLFIFLIQSDMKVLTFYYVDVWNSTFTWGGLAPPGEGEFVVIPKDQIVLLDADTEVLEMIVIMGKMTHLFNSLFYKEG